MSSNNEKINQIELKEIDDNLDDNKSKEKMDLNSIPNIKLFHNSNTQRQSIIQAKVRRQSQFLALGINSEFKSYYEKGLKYRQDLLITREHKKYSYGLSYHLYHLIIKKLIILLTILSILSLPSLIIYYQFNGIEEISSSWYRLELFTIGNLGDYSTFNDPNIINYPNNADIFGMHLSRRTACTIIAIFDTIISIIMLSFIIYILKYIYKEIEIYRLLYPSSKDYTITITNLPKSYNNRIEIADWFEKRYGQVIDVRFINKYVPKILQLYQRRSILQDLYHNILQHINKDELDTLSLEIDEINSEILNIRTSNPYHPLYIQHSSNKYDLKINDYKVNNPLQLVCITFNEQIAALHVYQDHYKNHKLCIGGKSLFKIAGTGNKSFQMLNTVDINTIYFNHLQYNQTYRWIKRLIILFFMLLLASLTYLCSKYILHENFILKKMKYVL